MARSRRKRTKGFAAFIKTIFILFILFAAYRSDIVQYIIKGAFDITSQYAPNNKEIFSKKNLKKKKNTFKNRPPPIPVASYKTKKNTKKIEQTNKPMLVFIIDDIGNTKDYQDALISLGDNVTYSILPLLPYSEHFSQISSQTKAEVILHLPLEANSGKYPGPGAVLAKMSPAQVRQVLNKNLQSVPHATGMSTHMGSYGTSNYRLMSLIMRNMLERNLFLVDSITTPDTVIRTVGKRIGLPVLQRDVFLDNIDNRHAIRRQIKSLTEIAKENGYAIGICHYRINTLKVLHEEIPNLKSKGFRIVSLKELLYTK